MAGDWSCRDTHPMQENKVLRLSQSRRCPTPAPRQPLQFHTSLEAGRSLRQLPARAVLMLNMLGCCCLGGGAELEGRVTHTPVSKHPPPPLSQAAAPAPDPTHGRGDVPVCASKHPQQRSTGREGKMRDLKASKWGGKSPDRLNLSM